MSTDAIAASAPSVGELRAAFSSREPPRLAWQGQDELSIAVASAPDRVDVTGRCRTDRLVVISGRSVGEPARADCNASRYTVRLPAGVVREIIASQVMLDGTVLAARHAVPAASGRSTLIAPADLPAALASAAPGDRLVVAPGRHDGVRIDLTTARGTASAPIIIDGNQAAIFTGASQIKVRARHVELRALRFENAAAANIIITAPDVRLTESTFVGCGDALRPQAECLLIMEGAARTELDFNTFTGSLSMSIKLRAGADDAPLQPIDASIHHNVFRDIVRRSSNGQEPIQVAGPGGGGSNVALRTRIEHNLFFRANGDVEAISIKTPGLTVRWNAFRDMDAAPNLRGSPDNIVAENVLIRTRPIRIAGPNNLVAGNILLCPAGGIALFVSHASPGYVVAADNVIRDNIVAANKKGVLFAAQTEPLETVAHGNEIAGNVFHLSLPGPVIEIRPPEVSAAVMSGNRISATPSGQKVCP
jgi:hypothetical protein